MSDSIFFDLQRELSTNPDFVKKVEVQMRRMQLASNSGDDEEFKAAELDLLRLCDFNASLLVPYFFPKFPDDEPMTLWERPHAISMMSFIPNGTLTVLASMALLAA